MTNTMVRDIELDELEIVSGGTVTEFQQIMYAYIESPVGKYLPSLAGGHIPGLNNASAAIMESRLEEDFDVIADISLGFCGTGIGSDPNTYKDKKTGQPLTHAQVLERIRSMK